MPTTRLFHRALFTLATLVLVGYAGFALYPSLVGPQVAVVTPTPYLVSESGALSLTGTATHFASLEMNGRDVTTRPDGTFSERMLLARGSNTFIFTAVDSFGTRTEKSVTVVYEPSQEKEVETARIVPLEETLRF